MACQYRQKTLSGNIHPIGTHPNRTYRSALYVRYDGRDVASRQLVVPDLKHIRGDSDDPIGETNRDPRLIMPIFREQWTATACLI